MDDYVNKSLFRRLIVKYKQHGIRGIMRSLNYRLMSPIRKAQWRVRRWWGEATGTKKVRSAYGVDLTPNWHDATFRLYVTGEYGMTLFNLLKQRKEPFIFIDVGANQGLYSLLASRNPLCRQVLAIEPVAETFRFLQANIDLNGLGTRIHALNWAISDQRGKATITRKYNHSGGASLERRSSIGDSDETVELHAFNELDCEIEFPELPIFIKIDVEGHELAVLRSLARSEKIRRRVTDVFYEVDDKKTSISETQSLLSEFGAFQFCPIEEWQSRDIYACRPAALKYN